MLKIGYLWIVVQLQKATSRQLIERDVTLYRSVDADLIDCLISINCHIRYINSYPQRLSSGTDKILIRLYAPITLVLLYILSLNAVIQ